MFTGGITVLLLAADVSTGETRADLSLSLTPELTASPHHQDEDLIYLSSSGRWSQCRMVRILLSRGITLQESTPALEITLYSPNIILMIQFIIFQLGYQGQKNVPALTPCSSAVIQICKTDQPSFMTQSLL